MKQQEAKTDVNDCKVRFRFLGAAANQQVAIVVLQVLHCFGQALTMSSFSPSLASMALSRCFFTLTKVVKHLRAPVRDLRL